MIRWRVPLLLLVGLLLFTAVCDAQTSETDERLRRFLERFPDSDADGDGVLTIEEAREFQRARRRLGAVEAPPPDHADVVYGPHERNVLDLWIASGEAPRPFAVFIHGGGWTSGDKSGINRHDLTGLLEAGISVAAINYRHSTQAPYPAPMIDAGRAIQFLRYRADEYDIDPTRAGAWGGSAGAATSMWLAFHEDLADPEADDPVLRESTRLTAIAPHAGPTRFYPEPEEEHLGPTVTRHPVLVNLFGVNDPADLDTAEVREQMIEASPITHLTADDPPAWLSYNLPLEPIDDTTSPEDVGHHPLHGVLLKQKMDELGIECVLIYPGHNEDPYGGRVGFLSAKLLP